MDESRFLSFDQFLKTPEIKMLNAALPYVSNQMRKPLAIYIKSTEMNHILSDFDNEEVLSSCGFETNTPDPEAMLKAMKIAGGKKANPQIDQMLQMLNMLKTYQKISEMLENNPEMMTFLNNMLNHSENTHTSGAKDSSDMMSLLSQMLKNSR